MLSTLSKIEVNDLSILSQMSDTVKVLTNNPQDLSEGTQVGMFFCISKNKLEKIYLKIKLVYLYSTLR